MFGQMQDWPMRVSTIIDYAARFHAKRPIISRSVEGPITRTNWGEVRGKSLKVAQAINAMGYGENDTIGVMAWNTSRFLEVWYGVSGAGAVLHTLNPRLFADQLDYIINHAQNRVVMVDLDLCPVLEPLVEKLTSVEHWIVLTDRENMPETSLPNAICYEEWVEAQNGDFSWVEVDERAPCGLCYTSGTTGNPKGVAYSHRSNVLHAMFSMQIGMLGLEAADVVMPVVPMFHANGWGLAYTGPMAGASMVMPGRDMSPEGIYEMLDMGVTVTAAVPTIWLGLLPYMQQNNLRLDKLDRVIIGGSSCPRAVIEAFQNDYGVQVIHAWGMTETSPLGTACTFKPEVLALDEAGRLDVQESVGHPPFGVDLRITDDDGKELPWDNDSQGKLWIRGPGVVKRYHQMDELAVDEADWFDTGDVATMDANAYVRITDRSKDVIKSGGEWISSIELENAAVGHAGVAEAAAIGVPHPKWDERPILCIVATDPDNLPPKEEILEIVAKSFAKWQVPDDIIFLSEIPHTATGKISKLNLRQKLKEMGYQHPDLIPA